MLFFYQQSNSLAAIAPSRTSSIDYGSQYKPTRRSGTEQFVSRDIEPDVGTRSIRREPGVGYCDWRKKKMEQRTSSTYFDFESHFKEATKHFIKLFAEQYDHHYDLSATETWQLAKNAVGQEYKAHYDYFNFPGYPHQNTDRIATIVLYLNDDCRGGETVFPELGLSIKPKAGYFLYLPCGSGTGAVI